MPRRAPYVAKGVALLERIKDWLKDGRTWTTLLYMALALPLGIGAFVIAVTGLSVSIALLIAPLLPLLDMPGHVQFGELSLPGDVGVPGLLLCSLIGFILLTLLLHAARFIGQLHGKLAKVMLVARQTEA